jgi:hypothetical protein
VLILAEGKEADDGEKSEGQDGEAGIGGGRIDHAEGDGGDSEACGQATSPPLAAAMTSKPRMAKGMSRTVRSIIAGLRLVRARLFA